MRGLSGFIGLGLSLVMGGACAAATIEPAQGDLSINQGQGFQPINSRVDANVGDAVMVGPGGAATVVYPDGCKVDVQPGAVTTIAPLSPCASGSYALDQSNNNMNNLVFPILVGTGAAIALGIGISEANKSHTPAPAPAPASP
jgi:hypothetical protein